MTDFLDRWAQQDEANARLVAQESLIVEVTEALWAALEQAGISKTQLAERLGKTKGHVSQLLGGSRNMTLRTLADFCFALDAKPCFGVDFGANGGWTPQQEPTNLIGRSGAKLHLITNDGVVQPVAHWPEAA